MTADPLVSVLTPSYNHVSWLKMNLMSVKRQTYPNVEHIVMDGGSTDGTVALLEGTGSGVRWASEPDRGQAHALNKAFRVSRGDIIGWINSDDAYFDQHVIADAVRHLRDNPDAPVVYGHSVMIDHTGRMVYVQWAPRYSRRNFYLGHFFIQPTVFFRREHLTDPFVTEDLDFAMDRELLLRLSARGPFIRSDRLYAVDRRLPHRKSLDYDTMNREYGILNARFGAPMGLAAAGWRRFVWGLYVFRGAPLARLATSTGFETPPHGWTALALRQIRFGTLILSPIPWAWASPN